MPALDPITGPIDRETFKELVAAPHGEAVKVIRKFDPQWGRKDGEKFRWKVKGSMKAIVTAHVMAADQKEADKLADKLNDAEFDTTGWCDIEIQSVVPDKHE